MAVNPDIQKERQSATFDTEKLTEVVYGGKKMVRRRRYLQNIIFEDKYLNSFSPWWNRTRVEEYDTSIKKNAYLYKLMQDLNITDIIEQAYINEAGSGHEGNPLSVHRGMFIPTIEKLGTREQVEKYVEPAKQYKIIGTYAQTEMGHGTFIRGLETTATYDPKTEEFVVNSPTVSSIKYWPAALGNTCNHVVLMAQLYSKGKCHGIHAFILQIRSMEDNRTLPGVSAGDIGNKLGFNAQDNGYLKFDNVRIPRESLLSRYAKVERDGTYIAPETPRLAYGTMVLVRALIVGQCAKSLAQACVITTRYSAVRRQTEIRPGGEEPQVIDYQTQQEKIVPLLAAAYAFIFSGNMMVKEYMRINADMEKGILDEMAALHGLSSGLKAFSAEVTSNGIDNSKCGDGFYCQGDPKIWRDIPRMYIRRGKHCHDLQCEGDGRKKFSDVPKPWKRLLKLILCNRYLVKQYAQAARGQKLVGFMSYLNNPVKQRSALNAALNMSDLIEAYEHAAARLIKVAASRLQALVKGGLPIEEARNKCGVPLVTAAKAHCQSYVVKLFSGVVNRPDLDPPVARVLETLCKLYAVSGINERLGEFIQDGFLDGQQADMILNKTLSLLAEIRPNAVALVDAFDYSDKILQSCIGRYDGKVYEALYEYAKTSPLNKEEVHDTYTTTLKPLMEGKLKFDSPSARL
ncbi:peroxisomal acyl-coenzyme A oxidase 1-like [Mercenaria mercenaria]|uniref:peroxisomal acyl-coenzyme A oxidase 1-like n=1 Tax=Mercenaria mercenaria TaxID=6596 RepID=UPI00234F9A1F|nr:peroxisomal acyl-coenzyme A oxidase 1-like [Mercenaria mercenaria]